MSKVSATEKSIDLTGLPDWAQNRIRNSPVPIDEIWEGWTDDLPVALSKRSQFIASTMRTIERLGRHASEKTAAMLTDALLQYYLLPGRSDLEHPQQGVYGWSKREIAQ